MALTRFNSSRYAVPTDNAVASQRWIDRGLTSLYSLHQKRWRINAVNGKAEASSPNLSPPFTFGDGWLTTAGATQVYLPHGLALNVALPITIFAGWVRLSGEVSWSLLRTDIANWTGIYGGATGEVISSNNNSFNGIIALASESIGVTLTSSALYGAGRRSYVIDSSITPPAGVQINVVTLGASRRSSTTSNAVARFTHFGVMQGAVDPDELLWVANRPGSLWEPRRIWVPVSEAGALPTLTALARIDAARRQDRYIWTT